MNESSYAVLVDPIVKTVFRILEIHIEISFLPHVHVHVSVNYYFLQIVSHKFYIGGVFRLNEHGNGLIMQMMWWNVYRI